MSRVLSVLCVVAVAATLCASGIALGETTTWDAYADFHTDQNVSTDTWQYLYRQENGSLSGNFSTYGSGPEGYEVWGNVLTNYHFIGKNSSINSTGLVVHPYNGQPTDPNPFLSVIGWKSPINGVVNVDFSVTDLATGTLAVDDGVSYSLVKGNTTLTSGTIDAMGATGPISVSGVSMASGEMLSLQIGARSGMAYDLTGAAFTITAVPEPATAILVFVGVLGLLAYAWRNRK